MGMRSLGWIALVLALGLAACGQEATGGAAAGGASATSGAAASAEAAGGASAPATPGSGLEVTDCGTFTLEQGEVLPYSPITCLVEAVEGGHPARLKVTRPTIEGDPIPITYIADVSGAVQVITDARQDSFGSGRIERQTCTGPRAADGRLDFARCSATP
jgi:Domain of unknown function (DUF4362)